MNDSERTNGTAYNLTRFVDLISRTFSLDEMETWLIFPLGLSGEVPFTNTKTSRAKELVEACDRRDMLPELLDKCKQQRPGKSWDIVIKANIPEPAPVPPPISDPVPQVEQRKNKTLSMWLVASVLIAVAALVGVGVGWMVGRNGRDSVVESSTAQAGFAIGIDYAPAETIYDFENCTEALTQWNLTTDDQSSLECSSEYTYRGLNSLSVPLNIFKRENESSLLGTTQVWLQNDTLNNKLLVMRIFVLPEAPATMAAHLLAIDGDNVAHFGPLTQLRPGAWNSLVWSIPGDEDSTSISAVGVEFKIEGQDLSSDESKYSGTAYLDAVEIYPLPTAMVDEAQRPLTIPVNVKERYDFETAVSTAPLAGWGLDTCPTLNTSQCGWINADSMLSSAQFGFSGQNSLQVSATLVNADQIYSAEYCFDPVLIDGISANVYIPTRETNQQALAATKIYLLARPQGDVNSQKQWPSSALALGEFVQPGWYQVSLDLSQVADENRRPYNTLFVDCVHIDLILPTAVQNEQAHFLIDDVRLYRTASTHDVEGNIPPRGLTAEETLVTAPTGEGIIFDFEDGVLNADIWTVSDNKDTQPVTVSSKLAYDGAFSLQFTPDLEEREGNRGGNTFCLKLNGDEVNLQNRIIISRLFIPEDAPHNLGVQYHLTGQSFHPSWANYEEDSFNIIKPGQWNTFAWYTADASSWVDDQNLELCLFLDDRNAENDAKNTFRGTFYLDSMELIPYHFTHMSNALKSVNYFAFDNDDIEKSFQNLMVLERFTTSVNPRYIFANEGVEALQIVLDLPAAGVDGPTSDNSTGLVIDTNNEPVEAIFTMVLVPEGHDGSVMVTFEGIPTNGDEPIKETFSLEPGKWTPIFWPVRGNDFDNASYTATDMEEVHILMTSAESYVGPIYFDYLGVYRYFPKQ